MSFLRIPLLALSLLFLFPPALSHEMLVYHSASTSEDVGETKDPFLPHPEVSPPLAVAKGACEISADFSLLPSYAQDAFFTVLEMMPCDLMESLKTVEIMDDMTQPRALAGRYTLKLRADVLHSPELADLLVHEFAHIIDLGGLRGSPRAERSNFMDGNLPIYSNDLSLQFYEISWSDTSTQKENSTAEDFVSGYASSDPFEDFSESFTAYVLHGNSFEVLAEQSIALQQKYNFFKDIVFHGREFQSDNANQNLTPRPWDMTKVRNQI